MRVRARVATAIAQLKPDDARALLDKLLHDDDAGVRGQALAGLALFGDRGALGEIGERARGSLARRAAGGARRAGAPGARRRRQQLLALGSGPHADKIVTSRCAPRCSCRAPDSGSAALPAVRAAAEDRDPALRAAAMNAAGELGRDGYALATAHLRRSRRRRAPGRRARRHRHRRATTSPCPPLVGALATPRRLDAADELARLGDARGLARADRRRAPTDAHERRAALALLAPLPAGHDALVAALGDGDADIRLDAAGALCCARLFRYDALDALIDERARAPRRRRR